MAYTVTAADVVAWMGSDDLDVEVELPMMEQLISAVAGRLERDYYISDVPSDDQLVALKMEVARLWARRNTPEGVGVFGADGVIRVTLEDLDVDRLLSRRWGFA